MHGLRKSVVLVGAAVVATLAVAVVALAQGDSNERPAPASASAASPGLGAFAGARGPEDALPAVASSEVMAIGPTGTSVTESVRAVELAGRSVFLTPAPGTVCLSLVEQGLGAAVNCVPLEAVSNGSASPSFMFTGCTGPPPEEGPPVCEGVVLYGVVPDGVDSVSAETASGRSIQVDVANNAFVYEGKLAQEIQAIEYVNAGGNKVRLPLPLQS